MTHPLFPLLNNSFSRRSFLALSGSLAASSLWSDRAVGAVRRRLALPDHPFQLGVASGDPAPDGFVIWTRLAPKPLEEGGMPAEPVQVDWEVADDEQFTKVLRSGTTTANPEWAHSVHVELEGLNPDRWYWYRFRAAGEISPVGRARTFPAAGSLPARMRFAYASCQHYEDGYYTAYEHMAGEDLDFVAHLGDYIYEGKASKEATRLHIGPEITNLPLYRNRHALYKTDPDLQRAHARFPWLVTWDDHELDNNCAGPVSQDADAKPEDFLIRRAAAYQAYYEHMPLRRTSLPHGPDMQLYRKLSFGNLAELFVLDGRQYRSDQPCGDGRKTQCPDALAAERSMLGAPQEKWLASGLEASPAKWNVLAQQVMMARVGFKPDGEPDTTYSMDQWPGYEANRRRILRHFHDKKIANPIVLTGDIHSNWANDLILDFDDLDSKIVASEFVGTSIASGGDGYTVHPRLGNVLAQNPFVKLVNAQRGYVSCTVTPEKWQTDYRIVEYIRKRGAPLQTLATFIVEDGRPGMQKA